MSKLQVVAPLGALSVVLGSATLGCGSDKSGSQEERAQATVKAQITAQLTNLVNASVALRAAAPAPDADGWNDTADAAAVNTMRMQWG